MRRVAHECLSLLEVEEHLAVCATKECVACESLQAEPVTSKADLQTVKEEAQRDEKIAYELKHIRAELAPSS